MGTPVINLYGQRSGRLLVIGRAENSPQGRTRWYCRCDCGKQLAILSDSLRQIRTKSCGCWQAELVGKANTTHGKGSTDKARRVRSHRIWLAMLGRCRNPHNQDWERYGGRGISVCESWLKYENFLADMGEPPPMMSIDRIDNDAGYSPDNCRWATKTQQNRNTSRNRYIMLGNEKILLADACRSSGVNYMSVYSIVQKRGLTHKDAFLSLARRLPASAGKPLPTETST